MEFINQKDVYFGIVVNVADPKAEGKSRIGYIDPDDAEVRAFVAEQRARQGRKCKDPGNISFVMPRSDHDTFFACEGNQCGIRIGHRVSFQWRWDKMRLPQAYNVRIVEGVPALVQPAEKGYVDPIQAQIAKIQQENIEGLREEAAKMNLALGIYSSEMPEEDDFEEIPEEMTEDEIDQDEVDFEAYYEN